MNCARACFYAIKGQNVLTCRYKHLLNCFRGAVNYLAARTNFDEKPLDNLSVDSYCWYKVQTFVALSITHAKDTNIAVVQL